MQVKELSTQLRDFMWKHECVMSPQARHTIAETIDLIMYYEEKEARKQRKETHPLLEDREVDA